MQILKLAPLSMLVLLSACGSTEKSMHSGDRIQNPNRIVAGAHVRILEVGDGDKRFDTTQSFQGVVCTVGAGGLRNDWSDGFYEGKLVKCSNGNKSYDFSYVKVEKLD